MTSGKSKAHRKSVACVGLNIYTEMQMFSPTHTQKKVYTKAQNRHEGLCSFPTHNSVTNTHLSETELINVKLSPCRKTTWLLISLS